MKIMFVTVTLIFATLAVSAETKTDLSDSDTLVSTDAKDLMRFFAEQYPHDKGLSLIGSTDTGQVCELKIIEDSKAIISSIFYSDYRQGSHYGPAGIVGIDFDYSDEYLAHTNFVEKKTIMKQNSDGTIGYADVTMSWVMSKAPKMIATFKYKVASRGHIWAESFRTGTPTCHYWISVHNWQHGLLLYGGNTHPE